MCSSAGTHPVDAVGAAKNLHDLMLSVTGAKLSETVTLALVPDNRQENTSTWTFT